MYDCFNPKNADCSAPQGNLPTRKHPRLKEFDYSSYCSYFITICVAKPTVFLSKILSQNGETVHTLTKYGTIVEDCIKNIPHIHPELSVDNFCIMPDHVHILFSKIKDEQTLKNADIINVVGQFKRAVTKNVGFSFWQKSFYDEVIEKQNVYDKIYEYITNNPYVADEKQDRDNYFKNMRGKTPRT